MILEEIKFFVKQFMNHAGHQYSHVDRVYKLVDKISLEKKEVNRLVLLTAAILHDIARANEKHQTFNPNFSPINYKIKEILGFKKEHIGKCHAKIGALWTTNYLKTINFPQKKIIEVANAIRTHRFSKGLIPETIEARILQECDKLDAIGAIGIIRTLISYPPNCHFYHPKEPIAKTRHLKQEEYGIDHFYTKLFKIKSKLTIPEVKEIAEVRHAYMEIFIDQLMDEFETITKKDQFTQSLMLLKKV